MKLEITQEEFNILNSHIKQMRCIIRDNSNVDYKQYCNGRCKNLCNRPDLKNVTEWLKSKVVSE